MQVFAVCIVQNEADTIVECLLWARRFCDRIWVWDLHSSDQTWRRLQSLQCEEIVVSRGPKESYRTSLRGEMVRQLRSELPSNSWVYVLDSDEFIEGDPRRELVMAEAEERHLVCGWQVNFYPVRENEAAVERLGEDQWLSIPLRDRLRWYRIEWLEGRFVKLVPGLVWDSTGMYNKIRDHRRHKLKPSRNRVLIRHYRYRSPSQVVLRYDTRRSSPPPGYAGFDYDTSPDFAHYVKRESQCRYWNGLQNSLKVTMIDSLRVTLRMASKRYRNRLLRKAQGR